MTNKLISQYPPRRRVQLKCPETSITDPDENRSFSMSNIKKRLDQGIMPPLSNDIFYSEEPLKYTNLQDALNFHQEVTNTFQQLPSELRKLMGNNIHNFEPFIKDPQNAETLKKFGLTHQKVASNDEILNELKTLNKSSEKKLPDDKKPA